MKWIKRIFWSSLPVVAVSWWLQFTPWGLWFFYYLSLWMVFYSKDESGGKSKNQNSEDLLGGSF
jgi:hypothetical protein